MNRIAVAEYNVFFATTCSTILGIDATPIQSLGFSYSDKMFLGFCFTTHPRTDDLPSRGDL